MSSRDRVLITSRRNRRIVQVRKLRDKGQRQRAGRFLVEGLQPLHVALDAGLQPRQVFYSKDAFTGTEAPALLRRMESTGAELIPVSTEVMQSLVGRDLVQGLLATFDLVQTRLDSLRLSGRELVVVLDRVHNPGNVGTLVRAADAAGASAVVLIAPCADPLGLKAVRGSMGSVFSVPLVTTGDVPGLFARLHGCGLRSVAADPHRGSLWGDDALQGGMALVLGNEEQGLSEDVRAEVQAWARLPMVGRAESLNVGLAGGILMYVWLRVNGVA